MFPQTLHNLLYVSPGGVSPLERDSGVAEVSSSLQDSLTELVDCAEDLMRGDDEADEPYGHFVLVGRKVLRLLFELGA